MRKGYFLTEETKRKLSLAHMGEKNHNFGKKASEETKRKIGASNRKRGGSQLRHCLFCGKEFWARMCEMNLGHGLYCNQKCYLSNFNKHNKKQDTDIELMLESWLKLNNVEYEKQKPLEGITIADFFIAPNIAIYADGDYWHSKPKVTERDKRITDTLIQKGYIVYRLKGSEITRGIRSVQILEI